MQNESRPDDLLTKRIAELEAQLADEKSKSAHYANEAAMRASSLNTYLADGTYTDEKQTTWTRPTAYAYAMVCGARNRLEAQLAEAREDARRLTEAEEGQYSMRYNAMNERWEINTGELHPAHRRFVAKKTLRAAIDAARGAK